MVWDQSKLLALKTMLAEGRTNKQIAKSLGASHASVRTIINRKNYTSVLTRSHRVKIAMERRRRRPHSIPPRMNNDCSDFE